LDLSLGSFGFGTFHHTKLGGSRGEFHYLFNQGQQRIDRRGLAFGNEYLLKYPGCG
jgi:hypothetical protein